VASWGEPFGRVRDFVAAPIHPESAQSDTPKPLPTLSLGKATDSFGYAPIRLCKQAIWLSEQPVFLSALKGSRQMLKKMSLGLAQNQG
jgi:hypothetical protein